MCFLCSGKKKEEEEDWKNQWRYLVEEPVVPTKMTTDTLVLSNVVTREDGTRIITEPDGTRRVEHYDGEATMGDWLLLFASFVLCLCFLPHTPTHSPTHPHAHTSPRFLLQAR